jgi:hypothetical protein
VNRYAWWCVLLACVVSTAAHAAPAADRYVLDVHLDPDQSRMAVAGSVRFPAAARMPVRISLGRDMTMASIEALDAQGAARPATLARVDSTDDDFVWEVRAGDTSAATGLRFRYALSNPSGQTYFSVGPGFAFARQGPHSWYPSRLDTRAQGEVSFAAPAGWTVASAGVRTSTPAAPRTAACGSPPASRASCGSWPRTSP